MRFLLAALLLSTSVHARELQLDTAASPPALGADLVRASSSEVYPLDDVCISGGSNNAYFCNEALQVLQLLGTEQMVFVGSCIQNTRCASGRWGVTLRVKAVAIKR